MSDKLRGVIFNTLGDIEGLSVLDAFAGSGAIGLEAASRGAGHVTLVENDKKAQQAIESNIKSLALPNIKLTKAPVFSWSENNPDMRFDLILADPPFNDVQVNTLNQLPKHISKPHGVLVLNLPASMSLPEFPDITLIKQKRHGTAQLGFYKAI